MRKIINVNSGWEFLYGKDGSRSRINLPHTWNGEDGQDGGNDYYRGKCIYTYAFKKPELFGNEVLYVEFKGVNASVKVYLNGQFICGHDGGYSAFRAELTPFLEEDNKLKVEVDNGVNDRVYPQRADFTFYGGIYRDVNFIIANKNHFDLDFYGCNPIKAEAAVDGTVKVTAYKKCGGEVKITVFDGDGNKVGECNNGENVKVENMRLWDGINDPYMYKAVATLVVEGQKVDEVSTYFGFRSFSVDAKKGFMLNGKVYPLRGVCRHQDRPVIGNAISKADHEEDIALIKEVGANTVRLAHYQHDDYFYELCDRAGLVVWAEIPYISRHMTGGNDNIKSQMKELIYQQYNHPSIIFWGISNEITMMKTDKKDTVKTLGELNAICRETDPSRLTTLACFAMCGFNDKTAHITDAVSWNLYLGWYTPMLFLNDLWMRFFRLLHPKRPIGYSEYGAEGMPNLHSAKPKRFDNTEEYQAKYHEYLLEFFARNPFIWGTYVWNMFDFGSDGRDQGGDKGKNHKGLVTFDRKTRKDAFYLYKVYWSKDKVLHLCGKRYVNRTGRKTNITIYSNVGQPEVYNNGKLIAKPKARRGGKVYKCKIKLEENNDISVKAGGLQDGAEFRRVGNPDPSYKVNGGNSMSWEK